MPTEDDEDIEMRVLCALGYVHCTEDLSKNKLFQGRTLGQLATEGGLGDKTLSRKPSIMTRRFKTKEKYLKRVAVFAQGVKPNEIPVPTAMKGIIQNIKSYAQ